MYFETNKLTSDRQGRLTLPKSLFKNSPVSRGGTLCVYPMDQYWIACDVNRIRQIIETEFPGSPLDPDVRDTRREFMILARTLHIDPQGRIQFQSVDSAETGSEYMVIGAGLEFEIWPLKVWQKQEETTGG